MAILYVGVDLAKNVFAVHGVNEAGKPELVRPSVPRVRLHELIASLPPCVIGMEACSGAHQCRLAVLVHTVDREDVLGEIDADVQNGRGLPLPSELMRVRTSHRGTSLPTAASRSARDGEVPSIH